MNTYHAELKHPQGAHYSLTATTPKELVEKLSRKTGTRSPLAEVYAITQLADEPDYLGWDDGWHAKVWKD